MLSLVEAFIGFFSRIKQFGSRGANGVNGGTRFMVKTFQFVPIAVGVVALVFSKARAQDESELAKKPQNPVADLISVPLQNNFNFGAGFHHNKMIYVLNIQPVIPIKLNDEWNSITRIVMPVINQPSLFPTLGGLVPSTTGTGFGDFNWRTKSALISYRCYLSFLRKRSSTRFSALRPQTFSLTVQTKRIVLRIPSTLSSGF